MKNKVVIISCIIALALVVIYAGVIRNNRVSNALDDILLDEEYVPLQLELVINGKLYIATMEENDTTYALLDNLPLQIGMNDLNDNEKYYYLKTNLPTNEYKPINIKKGDIMLFGNNCLVIFYKDVSNKYNYTKIGSIDNYEDLDSLIGTDDVKVIIE